MRANYLFAMLASAMFLWGAAWPTSKILVGYANAHVITFWRFVFVSLGSVVMLRILKISLKIELKNIKWLLFAGILNGLYTIFFFEALNHGEAGRGGVLVTTMIPVFSYLLFMLISVIKKESLKGRVRGSEIIGLLLGISSGLCLLNLGSIEKIFGWNNTLFLLCAFIWASVTLVTHKITGENPLNINFYVNLISLFMFSWVLGDSGVFTVLKSDYHFWVNMFIVTCLSNIIGTSVYYYGIHKLGNVSASSFVLIVPASALVCSYFLLNEIPSLLTLLGCVLAVCAIYFINIHGKKR